LPDRDLTAVILNILGRTTAPKVLSIKSAIRHFDFR